MTLPKHCWSSLAVLGALSAAAPAAPVINWVAVDSTNGTSPKTVTNPGGNSPIIGTGAADSADQIALFAPISGPLDAAPDITLADGFQVTLTGSALLEGSSSSMEQFRFGLFQEVGPSVDAFGWLGYIANNSAGASGGALRAKDASFGQFQTNLFISTSTGGSAVNLQTNQDGGSFSAGTYDFAMTIERRGAELSIDASLRRGTAFEQVWQDAVVTDPDLLTYNFNRVGFLSGNSLNADRITFSNIDVTTGPIPSAPALTLRVTTTGPNAGATRIVNTMSESISFNYYEVLSEWGSLNVAGWSSRDDHEGGDPVTVGWDEAASPTQFVLSEVNFLSTTTLAPGESLSLGRAFNVGPWPDLDFGYGVPGSDDLVTGNVEFVPGGPAGDFDGDGDVDDVDFDQWSDDLGVGGGSDADGNLRTDGADFLAWQQQFGTASAAAAASVVPEPLAEALFSLAALLLVYLTHVRCGNVSQLCYCAGGGREQADGRRQAVVAGRRPAAH